MTEKKWTLTDVSHGIYLADFAVSSRETSQFADAGEWYPGNSDWSVTRQLLRGGASDGVDVIHVNNGRLSFSLLPTRGMGLWKGTCDGLPLGWQSPVKLPVNPCYVNQLERGGLGWLGGFNEWMCRCGLDSNGAPGRDVVVNNEGQSSETQLTLHGKIANIPAHFVEVSITSGKNGKITVRGIVDETMMFGPSLRLTTTFETTPGSNRLKWIDEITNLRGTHSELELLYHVNLGPPFLEQGAKLVVPALEVVPRDARAAEGIDHYPVYQAPTARYSEQVYFVDLRTGKRHETIALLRNAHGDKGISLHYDKQKLPCFSLWKSTQAEADGYVTGLEPGTNYPNLKTFEREHGRVIQLEPGGTYRAEVEMQIHSTPEAVVDVEQQILVIQNRHATRVHPRPQPKYSPAT